MLSNFMIVFFSIYLFIIIFFFIFEKRHNQNQTENKSRADIIFTVKFSVLRETGPKEQSTQGLLCQSI